MHDINESGAGLCRRVAAWGLQLLTATGLLAAATFGEMAGYSGVLLIGWGLLCALAAHHLWRAHCGS